MQSVFADPETSNVDNYYDVLQKLRSGDITVGTKITGSKKKKLEELYEVTEEQKNFYNRKNVIYIASVPHEHDAPVNQYYQAEKEFFSTETSNDKLREQMIGIHANKSKNYDGPKWLGRADGIEISGNKIGFADEEEDVIEICHIIATKKFGRRDKRANWKEKENRGKNILFLSPIVGQLSLSEFKRCTKQSMFKTISYMREFEIPKKLQGKVIY